MGSKRWSILVLGGVLGLLLTSPSACADAVDDPESDEHRQLSSVPQITLYRHEQQDQPISRKQGKDLSEAVADAGDTVFITMVSLTLQEQRNFVEEKKCGDNAVNRFDAMVTNKQEHLAIELWKYCSFVVSLEGMDGNGAVVYLDSSSPLLTGLSIAFRVPGLNIAVLGDDYFPQTIHGSLLILRPDKIDIAKQMLRMLVETPLNVLEASPLLIPRTLYALIAKDNDSKKLVPGRQNDASEWSLLEHTCRMDPLKRTSSEASWTDTNSYRIAHHCPIKSGFCCTAVDVDSHQAILMSTNPLLPYQIIPEDISTPYNAEAGHYDEDELPFISTVREEVFRRPEDFPSTPNFFDSLLRNACLPNDEKCTKCLRDKNGANCKSCGKVCSCYCNALCHEEVEAKFVSKKLYVTPPLYSRDPNRLIPRIVHQTWFEDLTKEKYPNMSRLVESFRKSGWEYKFYSDDEAANFLSTHFPAEVREAYDSLRPGAFKADLFRYCVLLIHGGVYADVDIMLESSLDHSVAPDIGFMVPMDEPGLPVNKRMCLWNGLIAAAPGHPFLLKAVETVVNQVRNRFTSVDTDATFCPDPELSILHAFDTLFTAGPCLLGSSINRVIGRHGQTAFEPGEIAKADDIVTGIGKGPSNKIPGRTIILQQNKWDMGAHRFTMVEENLVVAATDLPDSNDRESLESESSGGGGGQHYSKTHAKTGVYGLEGLYTDKKQANEDIQIYLDEVRESQTSEKIA